MKNRKSCVEWASTTNEKEVINHKWGRNCQELTGGLNRETDAWRTTPLRRKP